MELAATCYSEISQWEALLGALGSFLHKILKMNSSTKPFNSLRLPKAFFSHSLSSNRLFFQCFCLPPQGNQKWVCVFVLFFAPSDIALALSHLHSPELSVWSCLGIALINSAETTVYKDITGITYRVQSQGQVA